MNKLGLNLINPNGLIAKLNREIIQADGYLSLGKPTLKEEKPSSFFDRFQNREVHLRRQHPLIQTVESSFPFADTFGLEKDRTIGYLFFEEGHYEYEGLFGNVELRIWRSLELEDEDIIPHCNIKLSVVTPEYSTQENLIERVDHVKRLYFYWKRTDLSKIIPTKWFL
ncbi:hypothetical protein KY306_02110 [Candidatus Woesearchaeota archaeon]|nr:hypothetical protein [Candidatus Woesearchaeota archaeon]